MALASFIRGRTVGIRHLILTLCLVVEVIHTTLFFLNGLLEILLRQPMMETPLGNC